MIRRMVTIGLCGVLWGVGIAGLPQKVVASGMGLHIMIAEEAIKRTRNPQLKGFLNRNKSAVLNGSFFPDAGFALPKNKQGLGHYLHSPIYLNDVLGRLSRKCSWPIAGECARVLGHNLGAIAHAVTDSHFDRLFVTEVARRSFGGNVDKAQQYTDAGIDMLAAFDQKRAFKVPALYLPLQDVMASLIIEPMRSLIKPADVTLGVHVSRAAVLATPVGSVFTYLYYKHRSSWAAAHYMTAPGGVHDSANHVVAMWEEFWRYTARGGLDRRPTLVLRGGWPNTFMTWQPRQAG